jgi:23S rRNA (uracil1939-C5)-methyltransferase
MIVHCPQGAECGACAHLGQDYPLQLRGKRETLGREMARYPRLRGVEVLATLPSPRVEGYRNRAKMAVGFSRRGDVRLGYFRAGTREIVDARDCRVIEAELLLTTRRLRSLLAAGSSFPRELRHIDLRCGTDRTRQHLTLVLRASSSPPLPLDALRRACPATVGIAVNLNPSTGPQVIRGPIQPLWGAREVWVDHAGLRLRVSPGVFFQVNLEMLAPIHRLLEGHLGEGDLLADLYSGVGTHGLALRESFRRVLCIEGSRSAVADLKATIRNHGLSNLEPVASSVERSLGRLNQPELDAVVLNPSRAGARESVLHAIASSAATRVAYLSCEPSTLCRDLDALHRAGFDVVSVRPIDMMPQTSQVEALALLRRRSFIPSPERTRSGRRRPRRPRLPSGKRPAGRGASESPRGRGDSDRR